MNRDNKDAPYAERDAWCLRIALALAIAYGSLTWAGLLV